MRAFTICYQPFALITTLILAHYESRINTSLRNLYGYALFFVLSFLVIVLDLATSGRGGIGTFSGLCTFFACFGIAHALVQGGVSGELSSMCPEFIQAFIGGITASGVVACGLRLLTKYYFEKYGNGLRKGALLSLGISTVFELLSIIMYAIYFPKLSIVKYYRLKATLKGPKTITDALIATDTQNIETDQEVGVVANQQECLSHKELFLQNIDYVFDVVMIYVLTLSIMPGFLYEDTGQHKLGTWYPLVLMTMYNVMDLIASYIPLIKFLKLESRKGLLVATLSRFLLIPAFYFTAKYGDQGWMILLVSYLGLTNGYLTVCVYTVVPKGYKGPEKNALGNLLALSLLSGICVGAALSYLWQIGK
ncbi:putative equilibrative nucleoside transporter [Medicago truncatula]|uniref:Equilibrative nucleoside transporter 6 n=1 Tax=Medicago truncatula TaxID=3880 RepID=A0A072TWL3_MEDTR|nr:equilibrative nucleotide transporter 3 [Medicago truncatula]KEH17900.1 equilibrative nucleoside transporter 6 [Medicago truncatula]RHN38681.1 putative equilibrative nucleoside transporter [Medicago truncatula]